MVDNLTQLLAADTGSGYDVDQVLFQLAMAVVGLATELSNSKTDLSKMTAYVIDLEKRALTAGLSLGKTNYPLT